MLGYEVLVSTLPSTWAPECLSLPLSNCWDFSRSLCHCIALRFLISIIQGGTRWQVEPCIRIALCMNKRLLSV